MPNKPNILASFAANDLAEVVQETHYIRQALEGNAMIEPKIIEVATSETLADAIIESGSDLLLFHYGGHANQHHYLVKARNKAFL